MTDNITTLDPACEAYAGRTLIVEPQGGYDWNHPPGAPFGEHGVPTPFHIRVKRVYIFMGERRGVVARVTEPGFVYHRFWLVCATRHIGVWNFTDQPATYNLLLCSRRPIQVKEKDLAADERLWPKWHPRGRLQASGFGRIAESLQCLAEYDARCEAEAQQRGEGESAFRFVGALRLERGD